LGAPQSDDQVGANKPSRAGDDDPCWHDSCGHSA
jgi:hypothetical protein